MWCFAVYHYYQSDQDKYQDITTGPAALTSQPGGFGVIPVQPPFRASIIPLFHLEKDPRRA